MTMTRHGSARIDLSTDCEVKIQRTFEAPMSLVFDALTKPEHVRVWFSADGVPLHVCEIDLRVGGKYHFAWHAKDVECSFRGTFMEIEPPTRIVNTWVFEGRPEAEAVETISLSEENGVTTMTDHLVFKDRASRDANFGGDTQGVQSSFNHLGNLLEDLLASRA
ncbi:MAG TPA: SRPBCC domain-containing protein [Anaeromyxobacteraceae bacterium]|nr:SRPBCC domain-containing protein [Anaeromyxobacteraceae bacterium]